MTRTETGSADREITLEVDGGPKAGTFAAGVAMGVLLGAAVALLFAPAPGEVTRERIRRRLDDVREYAEDEFGDLRKRARKELRRRLG